jgi:hypothetical protein
MPEKQVCRYFVVYLIENKPVKKSVAILWHYCRKGQSVIMSPYKCWFVATLICGKQH